MINYVEKGPHLHEKIRTNGYELVDEYGEYKSSNDVEVQKIIDDFDQIPYSQTDKIDELKAEGLRRIQEIYPAILDFGELKLALDQHKSIKPAYREPTKDFQKMIDTDKAGRAEVPVIQALTTVEAIEAYDVVLTPDWPA